MCFSHIKGHITLLKTELKGFPYDHVCRKFMSLNCIRTKSKDWDLQQFAARIASNLDSKSERASMELTYPHQVEGLLETYLGR